MKSIKLSYEKCGYSLYVEDILITDFSKAGFKKAMKQAEGLQKSLAVCGLNSFIKVDTTNFIERRVYTYKTRKPREHSLNARL